MIITIFDKQGNKRASIAPNDSSTQQEQVQGDNILSLSFTHYEHIKLEVNDYVDFMGRRYYLMEKYKPKEKSKSEWVYDIKLYGIESLIKRFLVLETTDGNAEPVFTLTAPPRQHVEMIVKCINDGMDHTTDWKVGQVDGTDNIVIDYHGKYCDEGLKDIAEKVGNGAEWWIEGHTINVTRCEHGDPITLGYGKGLKSLERDTSNTNKFYTRLFPIGSTRNIDAEKYGAPRLQLPGRKKYVELHTSEFGIYDHYEQEAFAGIYPRRIGTVSSVRYRDTQSEDGKPFRIYYFKDDSLTFDPNKYELPNEVKRVSFQDGELAGLGTSDDHYFEVNFDSDKKEFEIITIYPYDDNTQLPWGNLVPNIGDKYILWNLRMPDEYYSLAEEEFLTAVNKYNEEHWKDISVYKAPTDHVWIEDNLNEPLTIGRRIKLESDKFFPDTGLRVSRITRITRKVNLPSQMDLEISDALQQTALAKMNDSIGKVRSYTREAIKNTALPDMIRSSDRTEPTDNNIYSARATGKEFLSKTHNDRTKGEITFEKGITIGQEENAKIDPQGNIEVLSAIIKAAVRSQQYASGMTGKGFFLGENEDGTTLLSVDRIEARQALKVLEMLIEKIRAVGGQLCISASNGKIERVSEQADNYVITLQGNNTFKPNDLIRCQTFSGEALKSYWVEVAAVSGKDIIVPKSEFSDSLPEADDEIVLMGNTKDKARQNVILISATEDGQPRIDVLNNVSGKSFDGALRARLGNLDGIKDNWFPADNQPHGEGLYSDNVYLKGKFLLETGEDIKTKFEITEGKIQSAVESLRQDFTEDKGYLANSTFGAGLEKWNTANETTFFIAGNKWIYANQNVLSKKGNRAAVVKDQGRTTVRIKNKYITQLHRNLRSIPFFETNEQGKKEALSVYVSFFYRCAAPGKLRIEFLNVDKEGFENFNSLEVEEDLGVTEGYVQYNCNGLWNGTGDFKLSFTGDIYLYMLVLSKDKIEGLAYKYRTLFEQSDRLVKLSAAVYDKDKQLLEETGLFVKPKGSGIYSQDANGNIALIGTSIEKDGKTVVKLTGDNIDLKGVVTANDNFKVLEDGSVETKNAKISGEVNATTGKIGGFTIAGDHIGVMGRRYKPDGSYEEVDDYKGLFLYDDAIGFNSNDRQAILGTWQSVGTPMLVRLTDTYTDMESSDGKKYGFLPKYGVVFDIRNSMSGNFAFCGNGTGVLNGMIDGYAIKFITLEAENTIHNGDLDLNIANRFCIKSTKSKADVLLPKLNEVQSALGIGKDKPFAVQITIMADLTSGTFSVYGRNGKKSSAGDYPWNSEDIPVLYNEEYSISEGTMPGYRFYKNIKRVDAIKILRSECFQFMLMYNPEETSTDGDYSLRYTARILNSVATDR